MRGNHNQVVVPIAALRPLLQAWVDKQSPDEMLDVSDSPFGKNGGNRSNKGIGRLSRESGVPERRISGILNDSMAQKNVEFDTADRLLTAMQMNSEWHVSLAEYYVELEVAPYERDRDVPVLVTA